MMRLKQVESPVSEVRYDTETLRKVTALATRLQSQKQEMLTGREIQAVGAEVGLEPAFIQQALAQIAPEQQRAEVEKVRKKRFWRLFGSFSLPLFWLCFPVLLLLLPQTVLVIDEHLGFWEILAAAFVFSASLAASFGWAGAKVWESCLPLRLEKQFVSRPTLLNLLFTLQRQLEGQKQHRAFLSVDVAGSSEMKRSASELAVEHSFSQYRTWVEEVVQAQNGEMQSAAGDGVMALFRTDAGALRAARQLQEGLPRFNAEQNRLPMPFRIRCGVSAGEVAIEEGIPLGHLQSPVIDRAAALQKRAEPGDIAVSGELAATARVELGQLVPLSEPVGDTPAFSWRAGVGAAVES